MKGFNVFYMIFVLIGDQLIVVSHSQVRSPISPSIFCQRTLFSGFRSLHRRAFKSTSSYSAVLEVTRPSMVFQNQPVRITRHIINCEAVDWGLIHESQDIIAGILGLGPTLNTMSGILLEQLAKMPNETAAAGDGYLIDVHAWV
jgi:hypothetical protein